jgi:hypothetical protein
VDSCTPHQDRSASMPHLHHVRRTLPYSELRCLTLATPRSGKYTAKGESLEKEELGELHIVEHDSKVLTMLCKRRLSERDQ